MGDDDFIIGAIAGLLLLGFFVAVTRSRTGLLPEPPNTKTTYNNLEEWEFIKDARGRVMGVKVHRHAESS